MQIIKVMDLVADLRRSLKVMQVRVQLRGKLTLSRSITRMIECITRELTMRKVHWTVLGVQVKFH